MNMHDTDKGTPPRWVEYVVEGIVVHWKAVGNGRVDEVRSKRRHADGKRGRLYIHSSSAYHDTAESAKRFLYPERYRIEEPPPAMPIGDARPPRNPNPRHWTERDDD